MSNQIICDIANCSKKGKNFALYYADVYINESGKKIRTVDLHNRDLCTEHEKEYENRVAQYLLAQTQEKGLFFPDVPK